VRTPIFTASSEICARAPPADSTSASAASTIIADFIGFLPLQIYLLLFLLPAVILPSFVMLSKIKTTMLGGSQAADLRPRGAGSVIRAIKPSG
jgi:hypothetical protein